MNNILKAIERHPGLIDARSIFNLYIDDLPKELIEVVESENCFVSDFVDGDLTIIAGNDSEPATRIIIGVGTEDDEEEFYIKSFETLKEEE